MLDVKLGLSRYIYTHDMRTAFSAVIKSCSGLRSWFPPKAGSVELWAIFVAAVLNMMVGEEAS